jgi:hypothetical protein
LILILHRHFHLFAAIGLAGNGDFFQTGEVKWHPVDEEYFKNKKATSKRQES